MKRLVNTTKITHEEWLKYRKMGLTGTDASCICGLNPYKSAMQVFIDKTTETIEEFDNESMRQGRDLEQYVAERFCELLGKKVRRLNAVCISDEHPFMLADFDRVVVGERAGLECKTVSAYSADKWKNGAIPLHYQLQCQHYLAVSGFDCWYIAALILGKEFIVHKIERDEELIRNLITIEKRFWERNVLAGVMPEPDGSKQAGELLAKYYPSEKGKKVILTDKFSVQLRRREELAELIKKMETEKKTIEQSLLKYLGDNDSTEAENTQFFVRWTSYNTARIDADLLKREAPDIYERYKKVSPANRLTIKAAA
jgi:putative phage-type endonuclease